jgi:predicted permease
MVFFYAIVPLFALIGAGFLLGKFRKTDPGPLTDACLYILLPLLMFSSLVRNPLPGVAVLQIFTYLAVLVLFYWAAVWIAGSLLGLDRPTRSAITLSLSSVNSASYGLPVALYAFGDSALSAATLLVVGFNIYNSSLGIYIAAGGRQSPMGALLSVFKLPLIYAVILAVISIYLDLKPSAEFLDLLILIGKAGPQVALIVLGIQISGLKLRGQGSRELYGGIAAKLLLAPLIGCGLTFLIGAEGVIRDTLLLYSCLPTAISMLLLSVRLDARPDLVGGIIFVSTMVSPIPIALLLLFLGT